MRSFRLSSSIQFITCSFPELVEHLDSEKQSRLEQAVYASVRGLYSKANAIFQELETTAIEPVVLLEQCLSLERMGRFHDTVGLLQRAMVQVESMSPDAAPERQSQLLRAFISIKSAHATIRTQGLLRKAFRAAKELRNTLRDTCSPASMDSLEVSCAIALL